MPRTIQLHPLSLLVGSGAALLCTMAMSQVSVSRATTPMAAIAPGSGIGNPHPRDMQHFWSHGTSPSPIQLGPGEEIELFIVPTDRWLVIVNNGGWDQSGLGVWCDQGGLTALAADEGGLLVEKARDSFGATASLAAGPLTDSMGWTFKPGSRVVIKNMHPSIQVQVQYNLFGYLTSL